jgi:glycosyltransferase involved in cell wall biosynthesis
MIVGGAQENTLLNCLDLRQTWGDEVLLITGPSLGPEGELLSIESAKAGLGRGVGLQVRTLPDLRRAILPWRDLQALRGLKNTLREFRPDVVHTHSAKGGILGRQAAHSLQVPAILHTIHGAPFHDQQSFPVRWLYRTLERRAALQCHRLICVAEAMKQLVVANRIAPAEKCVTIYSGMEVTPFSNARRQRGIIRPRLGFSDEHFVVGKVARLFELKGHDDVIDAAVELVPRHPQLRFLFVGDGLWRERLQQRVYHLGLADKFVFTGLVSPDLVPEYFGAMDCLVHCSLREGLARALPQALISGIPAISYDIDGAREVVISGQTGILLSPRDAAGLVRGIDLLASDPALTQRLGQNGSLRFTDQFRHEEMTRRIREEYLKIIRPQQ